MIENRTLGSKIFDVINVIIMIICALLCICLLYTSAFSAECVEFDPVDGTDESSEGYRRIHKCTEKAAVV